MEDQERGTGPSDTSGPSTLPDRSSGFLDGTPSSATSFKCSACGCKRRYKKRRVAKDPPRGATDIKEWVAGVKARSTVWEVMKHWSERDEPRDIIHALLLEAREAIMWGCDWKTADWFRFLEAYKITPDFSHVFVFVNDALKAIATHGKFTETDLPKSPHAASIIALICSEVDSIPALRRQDQPSRELYERTILDLQPDSFYGSRKDALVALMSFVDEKRQRWWEVYGIPLE
ncbi:hypothetical protein BOTBODRAFT_54346 [Botryobasidium botryosum FD-172 SS1]|uniref:Uncharacterized protein n=1 Tax=Botryobasidium botryosum (strain FD-172 SS1) TaxID=930990 RepID=A0A067MMD6_BOTB1|nr:hypothetical protein BOTBODRAFT_54346 [Botryobasidium botryosum FD-172 SS1]